MIIIQTPLRISLFGGGTDFREYFMQHGGLVITATINKYTYVAIKDLGPFFEYKSKFIGKKIETFNSPDELENPLVRGFLEHTAIDRVHIAYDCDLPSNSGLGTSSSFAIGLFHYYSVKNRIKSSKDELARQAVNLERFILNESGGEQDQYAVSYGGLNKIVFNSEGISVTPLDVSDKRIIELYSSLILVFTGFTRLSNSLEFSKISSIEKKQNYYNQLKTIATQAEDILKDDSINISQIGYLLDESWQIKKTLGEGITNSGLDDLYTNAISNGALGGKILGAGGGGFFLFFVPLEKQKSFKNKIGSNRIVDFSFEYSGSKILFNDENEMGD